MYPEDFNAADAAYAPVSDGLFVGLSPLLLILGLVLLAAAGLLGWWLGRGAGPREGGDDAAPAEIHKAILAASSAAMAASSNDLKARAQTLRDRIADLLGPVLEVAKGVAPAVKALDEALKGERAVEAGPGSHEPPHPKPAPRDDGDRPDVSAKPVSLTQVYIGGSPATTVAAADHPHDHGARPHDHQVASPPRPQTVAMTGPEQIEALARAVRRFHDHWLDGPARVRELRAARAALSRRPPASQTRSHGH